MARHRAAVVTSWVGDHFKIGTICLGSWGHPGRGSEVAILPHPTVSPSFEEELNDTHRFMSDLSDFSSVDWKDSPTKAIKGKRIYYGSQLSGALCWGKSCQWKLEAVSGSHHSNKAESHEYRCCVAAQQPPLLTKSGTHPT